MKLTVNQLVPLAHARADRANIASVVAALDTFGKRVGLDQPHRIVHYLAQLMHESGRFRYDREVWGPTPAQERYDTRTDLGNTPERDGDGYKNRGRGPIQLTGGYNIGEFEDWCVEMFGRSAVPRFRDNPDLINTDPWEGLSAIWYWDRGNPDGRSLNRYADINDIEMITRRINGGLNGYADRLALYTEIGLLWLGYGDTKADIERFQAAAKATGAYTGDVDGIDGPKTRAAIHKGLVELGTVRTTKAAPVTEDVAVPVGNSESTAPLNTGLSLVGLGGVVTAMGDFLGGLHPIVQGGALLLIAAGAIVVWRDRAKIAKTARQILAGQG